MKNFHYCIITLLTALLLSACGTDKEFRINGTIDGMGTGNIRLVFYSGNAVQTMTATAIDGKFITTGRVDQPTVVRLYSNTGALLGRMAIEPGETVDVNFNFKEPWTMKADGNDDSEYLADFLKENAEAIKNNDIAAINEAVDNYVRKYPKRGVSGLLLTDFYTATQQNLPTYALLMQSLEKKPRLMASTPAVEMMVQELSVPLDSLSLSTMRLFCEGDSLTSIPVNSRPRTIVMVTNDECRWADSITASLSRWQGKYRGRGGVRILDVSVDKDTAMWHRSLNNPKADNIKDVDRLWAPSPRHISGLEEVPVAQIPWFIEADSTGRITYSGPNLLPN